MESPQMKEIETSIAASIESLQTLEAIKKINSQAEIEDQKQRIETSIAGLQKRKTELLSPVINLKALEEQNAELKIILGKSSEAAGPTKPKQVSSLAREAEVAASTTTQAGRTGTQQWKQGKNGWGRAAAAPAR